MTYAEQIPALIPTQWFSPDVRPDAKRLVWVLVAHPKKFYPQSFSVHSGQVEESFDDPKDWRVSQGDEAGRGWCSWYPAGDRPFGQDNFIAWAYVVLK